MTKTRRNPSPLLTFVPDRNKPEHWHIELNRDEAIVLRDWLTAYLST